jgi:hypothetical protein
VIGAVNKLVAGNISAFVDILQLEAALLEKPIL